MQSRVRKPKFVGKKTRWEKKRIARRFARAQQVDAQTQQLKKPLAEPLTIAPAEERQAALKQGKMVFYDGKNRIEILLKSEFVNYKGKSDYLQGVYKLPDGTLVAFRVDNSGNFALVSAIEKTNNGFKENHFFSDYAYHNVADLGHVELRNSRRGSALGLKLISKTERHMRSLQAGKHSFFPLPRFVRLFQKLEYKLPKNSGSLAVFQKTGKSQPLDNLDKFHRIEAIDPKTGKAKIFTFPIK